GGEVAVQVAEVGVPVDSEREGLLVQRIYREPLRAAPSVARPADRVLREDGVDAVHRGEGGVAGRAQVVEGGIGGEWDGERDRLHGEAERGGHAAAAAGTRVAEDVDGAGRVGIVLRLVIADLDVALAVDLTGAVVAEEPGRHAR